MIRKTVFLQVCFIFTISSILNARPIPVDHPSGWGRASAVMPASHVSSNQNDSLVVSQVGTGFWSWIQDAEVIGDYAVCAAYNGLLILDMSNPAVPAIVSRLYCPGYSVYHPLLNLPERDIDVVGDYAFMTAPCEGLRIFNISNPADPILVGHYDVADSCEAQWEIEVRGDYVFAVSDGGLVVLDITSLSDPHPVAVEPTSPYSRTMAINGNALYAGGESGLDVIDITNPLDPQSVTSYPIPCMKIQVRNDYAYIAGVDAQLIIADVSTPLAPQFIDTIPCMAAIRTAFVYGAYLYLGVDSGSTTEFGENPFDALEIFDLTDPALPSSINGYLLSSDFNGVNIAADGSRMCLISWTGVSMLDITNPADPDLLGSYGPQVGSSIGLSGDYAYFPGRDTLYVVDISNPADPAILNRVPLDPSFSASQTRVFDRYIYLYSSTAGIRVMDASVPGAPVEAGEYNCRFASFAVRDSLVYGIGNGLGHDSLRVINFADPANPAEIGSYYWGQGGSLIGIRLSGDYAYVAVTTELEQFPGLLVIGIADPAVPDSVGSFLDTGSGSSTTGDIEIRDTCVYIWGCATVINVADPAAPAAMAGSPMPPFSPYSPPRMAVTDNALILASTSLEGTYWVSDISDPAHPSTGNLYTEVGFPTDVATQNGYVFIPETVGLSILDISSYSGGGKYFVSSLADDGVGSLRLAIDSANGHPGADTILFTISGTIALTSPLPAINDDSTVILGSTAPGGANSVIIDGSGLSSGNGLTIQSSGNTVEGLTLSEFNDGIAINGTAIENTIGPGNLIQDCTGNGLSLNGVGTGSNWVYGNAITGNGLNGIYLTGSTLNIIGGYDETATNIICDNAQDGINIYANSDSNQVIGNDIGSSPDGPWGGNQGDGITIDFNCDGNIVDSNQIALNGGDGINIVINSLRNTISRNAIYGNGQLAIDLGDDGVTLNDPGDADTGPNDLLNYPVIDSINSQLDESFIVYGRAANDATIELFVAHPAEDDLRPPDPSGHGEAYEYIGAASASPTGDFSFATDPNLPLFSVLTGTATDLSGNTSEMSENFTLLPKPMIIVAYTFNPGKAGLLPQNGINMIIEDPNGDTIGLDENNVPINQIPGAEYIITANDDDSIHIPEPVVGDYDIAFIPEAGGGTGSTYSSIIRVDGSQQVVVSIGDVPVTGQVDTVTYTYDEGCDYINGDANGDGDVNVGDAVYLIGYIFKGGPAPEPEASADANCDGTVNIADAVYIISYVFKDGPAPCAFGQ